MSHRDNHGKVGKALFLRFTLESFNKHIDTQAIYEDKTELSIEELRLIYRIDSSVPLVIDSETKGDYECVCENGVEIRYYKDQ